MSNDKKKDDDAVIEQLRWLIDQKLEFFRSFESRTIQILGLNGIFMAIIWTQFSDKQQLNGIEILLISGFLVLILVQISVLVYIGIPRKAIRNLEIKESISEIIDNMKEYYKDITKSLKKRAKITRIVYIAFIMQIVLTISLVTLFLLN